MYDIGENVVIKESLKQGTVSDVEIGENRIQIKCEDGSSQWMNIDDVSKLLLGHDTPKGTFIQD
mgnify:FL=1